MDMSLDEIATWTGHGTVKALKADIETKAGLSQEEVKKLESGGRLRQDRCDRVLKVFFCFLLAARAAKQWSEDMERTVTAEKLREIAEEVAQRVAAEETDITEARERAEEYRQHWLNWSAEMSAPRPRTPGPGS